MTDLGTPWTSEHGVVRNCDGKAVASCTGSAPVAKVHAQEIVRAVNLYADFKVLLSIIVAATSYANPAAHLHRIKTMTHRILAKPGEVSKELNDE